MTDPLLVDCYELDGPKNWRALAAAGVPWIGARCKMTQGTYYRPPWFAQQLKLLATACPERNGATWFFGAYHYFDIAQDGRAQAEYALHYLETVLAICGLAGWRARGLLPLMVDVERGGQRAPLLGRGRVVDGVSAFAARVLELIGQRPTLYGGELLASLGITDHMGCNRLAIARYTPTLPHAVVTRIGWQAPDEWQYCGDGESYLAGYPHEAPGCGRIDISALVTPGGLDVLRAQLAA